MARLGLPLRIRSFECSAPRGTRPLGRLHRHRRSRSCRRACPSGLRVRRGAGLAHDPREHGHAGPSPGARREARKDRDLLSGEGGIRTLGTLWVHTLSRRAPSAARAPLRRANRRKCRREVQGDGARCGSSSAHEAHSVVAGRGGMDGTPPSPRPPGRRRRPRRRHGGGNHPSAPRPPAAVVPEVSRLAATTSGSDRLDAAEAAEAFAEVVRRIDFESLSSTRLARLLQVLIATFVDHERVQVLFSLLATAPFRRAFDAAAEALPPEVADAFAPLRSVHRRLLEEPSAAETPALLARGMEQILSAPDPVLRAYPEDLRAGLLELALRPEIPSALSDRAAGALLATVPREGRTYPHLALRRAAQLLERHADDRAGRVLDGLHRTRPDVPAAAHWHAALDARRLGRVALAGELPARGRLAPGFWLDGQRPVWLRTAAGPEAERLVAEARLQGALALPAVAPVVEHGVASAIPYVAVSGPGRPLLLDAAPPFELARGLLLAAAAARILRALALAGATLPDAAPERFLYAPPSTLVLADLDGVEQHAAADAAALHAPLAFTLARALVPSGGAGALAPEMATALARTLAEPPQLGDLIRVLDRVALRAGRA